MAFALLASEAVYSSEWINVEADFIELRTGPGDAFPIFYVAEKGEKLELLKRHNNWLLAKLSEDVEGWVILEDALLQNTQLPMPIVEAVQKGRLAIQFGWFDGSGVYGLSGGYKLSQQAFFKLELKKITSAYSGSLVVMPKIERKIGKLATATPFIELGGGIVYTNTEKFVSTSDQDLTQLVTLGIGVEKRISKGFFLRLAGGGNWQLNSTTSRRMWDARLEWESVF